jgi:hypothetical protein
MTAFREGIGLVGHVERLLWRFDHYRTSSQRAAFRMAQGEDVLAERAADPPLYRVRQVAFHRRSRAEHARSCSECQLHERCAITLLCFGARAVY